MAKHTRYIESRNGNTDWIGWNDYVRELPEDVREAIRSDYPTVTEEAKRTGESFQEVYARRSEAYRNVWADYSKISQNKLAQSHQALSIRNNTLDSFCAVYQRADRILTGLGVNVVVDDVSNVHAPAWNDGKTVTFNGNLVKGVDENTVGSLHGLNYHEVAHLMFSPRSGSVLGKWVNETREEVTSHTWSDVEGHTHTYESSQVVVINPARQRAFNILEDCRAEYYLTRKYPSVRSFLINLIGEYLLETPEHFADNFILLAGRRYLPFEVRKMSAQAFAMVWGVEVAKQVYQICSEYRTLVYPRDYGRGSELIEALTKLIPNMPETQSGCTNRVVMRNGKVASEKEQSALSEGYGEGDDELDDLLGDTLNSGQGGTSPEVAQPDFNDERTDEFSKLIEETIERAKNSPEYRSKVAETTKAINNDNSSKPILAPINGEVYPPTQADVVASRVFAQELERLRIECDPAWIQEKPTGKLNVRRAMNADVNEINKLFDRWETGNDDYNIEACVLLDRSGSMSHEIGSVCRSAWVIKRAIERINGNVTLMTFNDESRVLASREEKAKGNAVKIVTSAGSTSPYYALLESRRVFQQSKANTKLLFLLTDGAFSNESHDRVIEQMKREGVYTCVVYLGNEVQIARLSEHDMVSYAHGADDFTCISKPKDLVKVAKRVVRSHLKGVLAR